MLIKNLGGIKMKKKVLIAILIIGSLILAIVAGGSQKGNKVSNQNLGSATKFNNILHLINDVGVPTLFDKTGKDPFVQIYATSGGNDNAGYIEYIVEDKSSKEKLSYTINTYANEYENAKLHGKKKILKNGLEVYLINNAYYWHDKGKVYPIVKSLDKNTGKRVLEKAILSIGKTKFDLSKKIKYTAKDIVEPTNTLKEKLYEVSLEYYQTESKTGLSMITLSFNDFNISQSRSYDWTKDIAKNKNKKIKKETINEATAYIDNLEAYYTKNNTSFIIQANKANNNVEKNDLIKILNSINL